MYRRVKYAIDRLVALVLVVGLSPVLITIGILVFIDLGNPILFTQRRAGKDGATFRIIKFRTMKNAEDTEVINGSDEGRLTRFGRLLRASSLDELPEIVNVLRNEMSFVGPRPLLTEYLGLYTAEQSQRHDVKPGITGWAQVNGRNSISWEERFDLDIWYIRNQTLRLDMKIILMTVVKLLRPVDISAPGEATMRRFTGKKES